MIANAGSGTLEKRKSEIQRLIPDENLRHIIFNYEDTLNSFLKNDKRMIRYFYNALVVTSFVVYRAFLDWKVVFNKKSTDEKEREMEKFSNSTIRLFNLLESCYDIKKFDLDFIENLVLNLQIDSNITTTGANDFLRIIGLNNCFRFNDNLTKYIYKLKRSRISSRQEQNFDFDNLCDSFEMMFYLSKTAATFFEDECNKGVGLLSVNMSCDRPRFSLNIGRLLCSVNDIIYYLEDFEMNDPRKFTQGNMNKRQELTLNYIALSKSYPLKIHMYDTADTKLCSEYVNDEECRLYGIDIIERFLLEYNVINISTQPEIQGDNESYFFKDYISFNNRYIKYLALTISDFISFETKQRILQNYMVKYSEVFKKLHVRSLYDNSGVQYYRWDEVIIFLLLEEGVFEFLTFLLRHENYGSFILAFRRRFGNQKIDEIKKSNILVDKPTLNLQYRNKESEIKNHARAIILLATKLLTIDDVNYSGFYFSPSIGDIISDLQKKHESDKMSIFEHISYSVNLLIRVVLFVDAFYTGLLHYASEWKYWELSFSEDGSKSYEDYRAKRETVLRDVFSKEVNKKKSHNLYFAEFNHIRDSSLFLEKASQTVGKVFEQFIQTNRQATERENSINEAMYEALGKRELFSEATMIQYRDAICSLLEIFAQSTVLDKHHCDKLYKEILSFFKYLQNGSSNENAMLENAIYPLVGAYSNGVISRDGYRYSFMTVSKSNDERPMKIKMITDEVFDFGHMYYCVPNIKRVANITDSKTRFTERIWINPTIIPHQYYSSNISTEFSRLSSPSDFKEAAELVYCTDEKIYSSLFGDMDTAKAVLPLLFEDKNSVFYKDNYYIIKVNSHIAAIASLYHEMPEWNIDIIEKAFRNANKSLPDTAEIAYKYFEDTFGESVGYNSVICDLCVGKEYRHLGFARCMISNIVRQLEGTGRNLIITAYKDNKIAVNLYTSMGFIPYLSDCDTRGQEREDQEYYKMIKHI